MESKEKHEAKQPDTWNEEIEIPGHGKIEINVYNRNDLMVAGEIDGFEIWEFHVDKHNAASWGPGWVVRTGYASEPSENPPERIQKLILPVIEEWARRNAYKLDVLGQAKFASVVSAVETGADSAIEAAAEFVDNTVCTLLDQYEEWLLRFDGGKTLKDLEQVIALFNQARQLLGNVVQPDLQKLSGAISRYLVQKTPVFTIEQNWGRASSNKKTIKAARAVAA